MVAGAFLAEYGGGRSVDQASCAGDEQTVGSFYRCSRRVVIIFFFLVTEEPMITGKQRKYLKKLAHDEPFGFGKGRAYGKHKEGNGNCF